MQQLRLPKDIDPGHWPLVMGSWAAQKGQVVATGQALAIIETPVATIEVRSTLDGAILDQLVYPGQVLQSGQAICEIGPASAAGQGHGQAARPGPTDVAPGKVVPILMPQAGQTMEEGTILSWKIKEGDLVQPGQVILEIETDKAAMDVEAPSGGRVARIVAKEGQVVPVKTPIAYLADSDADLQAYLASQGQPLEAQAPSVQAQLPSQPQPEDQKPQVEAQQPSGRLRASPAARRLAAQMGIDLRTVPAGSGPAGRIISTDLLGLKAEPKTAGLTKMRLAIARNLLWSKQNIPHFYAKRQVDAQALMAAYRKYKQEYGCTINDLIVAAVARAVRQFPAFRSQFRDNNIVELPSVNIGIAVGTDQGLTVPVLLDADRLDLRTLAERTKRLVENARAGRLEGVGQGVFTVTNLGMFGVEEFYAIINPPESAILAVGAVRELVKVEKGNILPTHVVTLCLSVDHRVIDGVLAAQFLAGLAELLQEPDSLLEGAR